MSCLQRIEIKFRLIFQIFPSDLSNLFNSHWKSVIKKNLFQIQQFSHTHFKDVHMIVLFIEIYFYFVEKYLLVGFFKWLSWLCKWQCMEFNWYRPQLLKLKVFITKINYYTNMKLSFRRFCYILKMNIVHKHHSLNNPHE